MVAKMLAFRFPERLISIRVSVRGKKIPLRLLPRPVPPTKHRILVSKHQIYKQRSTGQTWSNWILWGLSRRIWGKEEGGRGRGRGSWYWFWVWGGDLGRGFGGGCRGDGGDGDCEGWGPRERINWWQEGKEEGQVGVGYKLDKKEQRFRGEHLLLLNPPPSLRIPASHNPDKPGQNPNPRIHSAHIVPKKLAWSPGLTPVQFYFFPDWAMLGFLQPVEATCYCFLCFRDGVQWGQEGLDVGVCCGFIWASQAVSWGFFYWWAC